VHIPVKRHNPVFKQEDEQFRCLAVNGVPTYHTLCRAPSPGPQRQRRWLKRSSLVLRNMQNEVRPIIAPAGTCEVRGAVDARYGMLCDACSESRTQPLCVLAMAES
jgi:hypothetical protein